MARLPRHLGGKESVCQHRRNRFSPTVRKISWRRKWQATRVVLPGKSHGQRSLEGCSSWGHRESDTSEWLNIQALRAGPLENETLGVELNEMTDFHWSVDFIDLWELNLEHRMLPWPHPPGGSVTLVCFCPALPSALIHLLGLDPRPGPHL